MKFGQKYSLVLNRDLQAHAHFVVDQGGKHVRQQYINPEKQVTRDARMAQ